MENARLGKLIRENEFHDVSCFILFFEESFTITPRGLFSNTIDLNFRLKERNKMNRNGKSRETSKVFEWDRRERDRSRKRDGYSNETVAAESLHQP